MTQEDRVQILVQELDSIDASLSRLLVSIQKNQAHGNQDLSNGDLFDVEGQIAEELKKENIALRLRLSEYESLLIGAATIIKDTIKDLHNLKSGE